MQLLQPLRKRHEALLGGLPPGGVFAGAVKKVLGAVYALLREVIDARELLVQVVQLFSHGLDRLFCLGCLGRLGGFLRPDSGIQIGQPEAQAVEDRRLHHGQAAANGVTGGIRTQQTVGVIFV
jgi:hypothetical protein